jgi:photosystem II stability/assembly factor-like uncharacterized protein
MATGRGWLPPDESVWALAISPSDPQTVYVGGSAGVYQSGDGGATWIERNTGLPTGSSVFSLSIEPTKPQTIFATVDQYGVWVSRDGGASWTPTTSPSDIWLVVVDPLHAGVVYGAGLSWLYRSSDDGATWTKLVADEVTSLVVSRTNPAVIIYGAYSHVRASSNGTTWHDIGTGFPQRGEAAVSLAVDTHRPWTLHAGTFFSGVLDLALNTSDLRQATS